MEKSLPRAVLSAREVERVLQSPCLDTLSGIRDRAIMEVFYSTGVRRAELAALEVDHLDDAQALLTVRRGKGGKDRIIPIGCRAIGWVHRYLKSVRPLLLQRNRSSQPFDSPEQVLFLDDRGQPWPLKYLSAMVTRHVRAANLRKTGSCHLFRHTCATLMLENGADIRYIQQLLGHANLATTEVYTQVSIRPLNEVHTRTHPAKMPGKAAKRD